MPVTVLTSCGGYATSRADGAVAQLGERVVRNDEVVGSIPIGSTKSVTMLFEFMRLLTQFAA